MQKEIKVLHLKNNTLFINSISKINNRLTDNAQDLDRVMPMYNLLEYSKNYKKTTDSLWSYYKDEPSNPLSLKYKTSITGNTYDGKDANKYDKVKLKLLFH